MHRDCEDHSDRLQLESHIGQYEVDTDKDHEHTSHAHVLQLRDDVESQARSSDKRPHGAQDLVVESEKSQCRIKRLLTGVDHLRMPKRAIVSKKIWIILGLQIMSCAKSL
jgi:hypothetical protein